MLELQNNDNGVDIDTQGDDQESVFMPNEDGKNYLCFLPKIEKPKSGKPVIQFNTSSMIMGSEKPVKVKTPDELLEVLEEQCLLRVSIKPCICENYVALTLQFISNTCDEP